MTELFRLSARPALLCLTAGLLGSAGRCLAQPAPAVIRGEPIGGPPQTTSPAVTNTAARKTSTNVIAAPKAAPPPVPKETKPQKGRFLTTGFDKLSAFNFDPGLESKIPDSDSEAFSRKVRDQIPTAIRALDEKPVSVQGFMLPMKLEDGKVTEFLLLKTQMGCCFGGTPAINEWISVRTAGRGVQSRMDELITVFGTLHVGEIRENGYLTGIYEMDCEKIE